MFCDLSNVRVFWRAEPAKYRYPLALVGLRSKTSLVTYLARSLYRFRVTGKMPAGLTGKMAVLREKRLFPTHFSSSFRRVMANRKLGCLTLFLFLALCASVIINVFLAIALLGRVSTGVAAKSRWQNSAK